MANFHLLKDFVAIICQFTTSENLPLCIMQFLDNYNYFGYLKGANEVNRQYLQQAVLLCWLKALYYAGICSYAGADSGGVLGVHGPPPPSVFIRI